MAATLRINGRDYSPFLKLFTEESVGVVDAERLSPQFAGNAALSEGAVWIGTSSVNKHWTIGVIVRGASLTVDSVNQMVRDIRGDLYRGAVVEYAPDGASQTTFFELEAGEFRPNYNHPRYRHGYVEGVLELWTRPYGSTGTYRSIASVTGTGPYAVAATGILGDVPADARVSIAIPSMAAAAIPATAPQGFFAYAIAHASYLPVWTAASLTLLGSGTRIGASGALASQYYGFTGPLVIGASQNLVAQFPVPASQVGRHRVLGIVNHRIFPATAVSYQLDNGYGYVSPTVLATQNAADTWQVIDLGEITRSPVPSGWVEGLNLIPTLKVSVASAASIVASAPIRVAGFVTLPVDQGRTAVVMGGSAPVPPRVELQSGADGYVVMATPTAVRAWNLAANTRGDRPQLDPTGSPVASGARQMIVMAGNVADYRANDRIDVRIAVKERFAFFK